MYRLLSGLVPRSCWKRISAFSPSPRRTRAWHSSGRNRRAISSGGPPPLPGGVSSSSSSRVASPSSSRAAIRIAWRTSSRSRMPCLRARDSPACFRLPSGRPSATTGLASPPLPTRSSHERRADLGLVRGDRDRPFPGLDGRARARRVGAGLRRATADRGHPRQLAAVADVQHGAPAPIAASATPASISQHRGGVRPGYPGPSGRPPVAPRPTSGRSADRSTTPSHPGRTAGHTPDRSSRGASCSNPRQGGRIPEERRGKPLTRLDARTPSLYPRDSAECNDRPPRRGESVSPPPG